MTGEGVPAAGNPAGDPLDGARLRAWLAHGTHRASWGNWAFGPPDPLPAELEVPAARNQVIGAQLLLLVDADATVVVDSAGWLHSLGLLPRLRVEVDLPSLPGATIEPLCVGYVEGDDHGEWPETLLRSGHAEVPAGRPQPVYFRIHVPADAAPGEHVAEVRVLAARAWGDESLAWTGRLSVRVADVLLPDPRAWEFHLDLWQQLSAIARQHRVGLWSDAHLEIVDRYLASAAAIGQKVLSIVATEDPWSGWYAYRNPRDPAYFVEHGVIGVIRARDGSVRLDFGVLDRLLAMAARHGIDREIEVFGLVGVWRDEAHGFGRVIDDAPDAVRVRCRDEASGRYGYLRAAAELRTFVAALRDHLAELGVLDRVRIAADEPNDPEELAASLRFLEEAAPGLRYKVAVTDLRPDREWPARVTDVSVGLVPLAARSAEVAGMAAACHAGGGRLSFYLCCREPYPNNFVHSPLVEGVLAGWLAHLAGLDGFLRWAFCLWPADPWHRVTRQSAFDYLPAGDMYFVLPGPDGAPVETLRYESIRAAGQDFELLRMVERALPAAEAAEVIGRARSLVFRVTDLAAFANVGSIGATAALSTPATVRPQDLYSLDPADYAAARQVLLEALAAAGGEPDGASADAADATAPGTSSIPSCLT